MPNKNGRLVALVASTAVAAIVIGAAVAYRQGPQAAQADAAPLSGSPSPTPKPTLTPSATPVTTPKPPSSAPVTSSGPTTITLNVAKLPKGRAPQMPYLIDRTVLGGAGYDTKIPGSGGVVSIGRLDSTVLAVVLTDDGTELVKLGPGDDVRHTPNVSSLVTAPDQSVAAYAAAGISSLGRATKGGTLYAENFGSVKSLKLPDVWNLQVLSYVGGKVYYRAGASESGGWKLYTWTPGATTPDLVKTVTSPTAVSDDGRLAASAQLINDGGSCSSVVEVASGKQLFRTCENMISDFTPDGSVAVGEPDYGEGYCSLKQTALDAHTGKVIREWKGCFHRTVAEDDQHFLFVAVASGGGGDPGTKSAIIRCAIDTADCELATTITTDLALAVGR